MNNVVDERNSPMKASEAAAKLLAQNYKILKTWPLALTAYNHGPGGLIRAEKKLKTDDISTIVEEYDSRSFGFASSNFYSSFLAVLHVEKYQKELFGDLKPAELPELQFVELNQSVKLKPLLEALDMDADELRLYNMDIRERFANKKNTRLPRGYHLYIPSEMKAPLEAYLESLPKYVSQRDSAKRSNKL